MGFIRQKFPRSSAAFRLFSPWSAKRWAAVFIFLSEHVKLQTAFSSVITWLHRLASELSTLPTRNADGVFQSRFWVPLAAGQDLRAHEHARLLWPFRCVVLMSHKRQRCFCCAHSWHASGGTQRNCSFSNVNLTQLWVTDTCKQFLCVPPFS